MELDLGDVAAELTAISRGGHERRQAEIRAGLAKVRAGTAEAAMPENVRISMDALLDITEILLDQIDDNHELFVKADEEVARLRAELRAARGVGSTPEPLSEFEGFGPVA